MITKLIAFFSPYKTLILIGVSIATIGGVYWKGHSDGSDSEKLKNLSAENKALIETSKAIAEAFGKYEPILADLHGNPDPTIGPKLMRDTVRRLPDPKSKAK